MLRCDILASPWRVVAVQVMGRSFPANWLREYKEAGGLLQLSDTPVFLAVERRAARSCFRSGG